MAPRDRLPGVTIERDGFTALNVCSNTNTWTQVALPVGAFAGQTVVLYFNVNDDGYPTDPSAMFLDDVAIL